MNQLRIAQAFIIISLIVAHRKSFSEPRGIGNELFHTKNSALERILSHYCCKLYPRIVLARHALFSGKIYDASRNALTVDR